MATITTPAAGVSPYQAVAAAPTVLRADANGNTVLANPTATAAADANTLVVVNGQAALNNLITTSQPGVFDGANVTINLEEQNFTTTNQVTATTNYPSGNTGEIQFNSGSNSFASNAFFTYANSNVVTPGIRTDGYFYSNGSPFTGGGNAAIGNFIFTGDAMTIAHANSTLSVTGNGTGNVNVTANSKTWIFGASGNLTLPANTFAVNYANGNPVVISGSSGLPLANGTSNINIATANGNVTVTANAGNTWTFNTGGNLVFPTGMIINNEGPNTRIYQTSGSLKIRAENTASLRLGWDEFINVNAGNLAQIIVNGTSTGEPLNVVVRTGNISSTTYYWFFDNTGNLKLPGNTFAVKYANGNSVVLGSGLPLANGTSNINIATANGNVTVTANAGNTWTFATTGNLVFPSGLNILNESPNTRIQTNTGRLRIIASSNAYLNIGWDQSSGTGPVAKIYANGTDTGQPSNVVIKTGNFAATTYDWVFGNTGNLAAPGRISATNIVTNSIASDDSSFVTIEDGVNVNGEISATGNITGGNLSGTSITGTLTTGTQSAITSVGTLTNISTSGNANVTGNVNSARVSATGNITAGNILTGGLISATGNITGNYFLGNGSALTGIAASVPSQTILPTIQTITVAATSGVGNAGGGGSAFANVTVANNIPVTEYGVIITAGTISETYKTGALGSIPGTVQLTFTTGLNSTLFTVYAYVTSNAGTYYSNAATGTSGICLLAGTQIALSDGTHKAIEDITYTDKLLSWDFDRGCYAETTAMWIKRSETGSQYNLLTFSDGTTLRTFDQHRIFNKQAGAFTYPMTAATPVGTVTVNEHGQEISLTRKQVIRDTIEYYNVITDYHMNLFSDSVLTSCRFNNIYPIVDMKFAKDNRTLRTRAEFENVPDRFFHGLRLAEQTADIETVEWYVNRLLSTEVSTQPELAF